MTHTVSPLSRATLAVLILGLLRSILCAQSLPRYSVTDVGFPSSPFGTSECGATGINDNGQVVGQCGARAFMWDNGSATELKRLPGTKSCGPVDINNLTQVIGNCYTDASTGYRAILWQEGIITELAGVKK
jgi:probable HAF family extracellular repeat protein